MTGASRGVRGVRGNWRDDGPIEPGAKLQIVEFNGSLRLVPQRPPSALRGIARGIDTNVPSEPDRPL